MSTDNAADSTLRGLAPAVLLRWFRGMYETMYEMRAHSQAFTPEEIEESEKKVAAAEQTIIALLDERDAFREERDAARSNTEFQRGLALENAR